MPKTTREMAEMFDRHFRPPPHPGGGSDLSDHERNIALTEEALKKVLPLVYEKALQEVRYQLDNLPRQSCDCDERYETFIDSDALDQWLRRSEHHQEVLPAW